MTEQKKKIGIWMDHASAHLMPFTTDNIETTVVHAAGHMHPNAAGNQGDIHMHNAEQHQESAYYKHLGESIKAYDEVLLFGPTDAKAELHNILKEDSHFDRIKITVEQADKLTDNQMQAYVKAHFSAS